MSIVLNFACYLLGVIIGVLIRNRQINKRFQASLVIDEESQDEPYVYLQLGSSISELVKEKDILIRVNRVK